MDDAGGVSGFQRASYLKRVIHCLGYRELANFLTQRDAFNELTHHVLQSVLLAKIVDREDVRVVELRRGAGFPPQAFDSPREIVTRWQGQDFNGYLSFQPGITCQVDFAHAALS